MRKLVLTLFAMIFPVWGCAQPKAVGVRVGLIDWAVSYQHYSGQREDFIETTMSIMLDIPADIRPPIPVILGHLS